MILFNNIPSSDDRYFINVKEGGLNPFTPRPNGSNLRFQNCTFFAAGALAKNSGVWITPTNAENFCAVGAQMKKLIVSDVPLHGSIAVWRCGQIGNGSDGAGHVAQVIGIGSTHILVGQSGWSNSKAPFWTSTCVFKKNTFEPVAGAKYSFVGYLCPFSALKYGSVGEYVKELQRCLIRLGFLRKGEDDGDFGLITEGAVCCYQLHNPECGTPDGIAGTKTIRSIAARMMKELQDGKKIS